MGTRPPSVSRGELFGYFCVSSEASPQRGKGTVCTRQGLKRRSLCVRSCKQTGHASAPVPVWGSLHGRARTRLGDGSLGLSLGRWVCSSPLRVELGLRRESYYTDASSVPLYPWRLVGSAFPMQALCRARSALLGCQHRCRRSTDGVWYVWGGGSPEGVDHGGRPGLEINRICS